MPIGVAVGVVSVGATGLNGGVALSVGTGTSGPPLDERLDDLDDVGDVGFDADGGRSNERPDGFF